MRLALALPVLLAACVQTQAAGDMAGAGTAIEVGGKVLVLRQEQDWPSMVMAVEAGSGETVIAQSGTAPTVIVSGSRDSRDLAIRALAQFCGRPLDAAGFDTQFVYQEPKLVV
jgi:hypothetical protein